MMAAGTPKTTTTDAGSAMTVLQSTRGQSGLPRYFARVYALANATINHGRLDMVLPDGRRFRAGGRSEIS